MDTYDLIVIGSGQAGVTTAKEVRKLQPEAEILIITADEGGFYSKPMLSNAFQRKLAPEKIKIQEQGVFDEKNALNTLANHYVTQIQSENNQISVQGGENEDPKVLQYKHLVIATGANPIQPPFPGGELGLNINHLSDYQLFREHLEQVTASQTTEEPAEIVIIGGGLVGCELANDLLQAEDLPCKITLVEQAEQLMGRIATEQASEGLKTALSDAGLNILTQTAITSIAASESGYTLSATNSEGEAIQLEAHIVLQALGLQPNTDLAQTAGIDVNRGIVCNEYLQTSAPNIFAIGDCAQVQGLVLPYILPIMEGAKTIAAKINGEDKALAYPAFPVAVKTPAYPMVICPPLVKVLPGCTQTTTEEDRSEDETGLCVVYLDNKQQMVGFNLTGAAVKLRASLGKETLGYFQQIKDES